VITTKIKKTCKLFLGLGIVCFSNSLAVDSLIKHRKDFLLAEKLWLKKDQAAFLTKTAGLVDYPLYPYLQYQALKDNLEQADEIKAFLARYPDAFFSEALRLKWLNHLAKKELWLEFIHYYQPTDNVALKCQYDWAQYKTGNETLALADAKSLWLVGTELPKECSALFDMFLHSSEFNKDLLWSRFERVLTENNSVLAHKLKALLSQEDQPMAELWLRVHKEPNVVQGEPFLSGSDLLARVYAYGIARLAKSDINLALSIWESRRANFFLDPETLQNVERKLALNLASAHDQRAYEHLSQLVVVDSDVKEWRIRSALLEQNWSHVIEALAKLSTDEKQLPQWQYWQARALLEVGDQEAGQAIFKHLAEDRSYYGFLAAEKLDQPYQLSDKPVGMNGFDVEALTELEDFKIIQEFKLLGWDTEAKRHWQSFIKKLSKEQLKIAAKFAQQWHWDQIAIITLVKADYWDDLAIRFPLKYVADVESNAELQALEPGLLFGLMRQESMMDENARSSVGALGLMQMMPATGQEVAQQLQESSEHITISLLKPALNIKYGTFYYKQLLNQFEGQLALATAAYNAGPKKVTQWLPVEGSVPSDIWVETIPYKETRKYVASVLSYSVIYQQLMHRNALKLSRFLYDVHLH
jgi:soluble lytic murein transglycosylase